jgi:hypothetical protein
MLHLTALLFRTKLELFIEDAVGTPSWTINHGAWCPIERDRLVRKVEIFDTEQQTIYLHHPAAHFDAACMGLVL